MMNKSKTIKNKKIVADQEALLYFIEGLISEGNNPAITEDNLPRVKILLLQELNQVINTYLVNILPKKDRLVLNQLLKKNPTDEELGKFFQSKIPNLEVEVAIVLMFFRSIYLSTSLQVH